jgi:long-chain acyl-CoA synthetase
MALHCKPFWQDFDADSDACTFLIGSGQGDRAVEQSYAEVFANGDALMGDLARGVVAILCDKSIATVTAYFGALRNGLVPLMLDADAKPAALKSIFSAYRPDYVFDPQGLERDDFVALRRLKCGTLMLSKTPLGPPPHADLAALLGTSGSTGDPKFVRLSYKSLDTCTQSICDYLDLTADRRCISLLPLHYSYGLSVLNTAAARRASFVVSNLSVLDRDFWPLLAELRVTDFSGVPFVFEVLRRTRVPPEALEQLKCVTQAGGPLDIKLTRYFRGMFAAADVRYFTMYGQTEASPRISYLPPEYAAEKDGSVGIPISHGEAIIAETGAKQGEGELLYRGPNVALGYAFSRNDLVLGDVFNGALLTGDHVRIDDDGFIFIIGRRKRFIKLHGISVSLDHIESVLKGAELNCVAVGRENLIIICYSDCEAQDVSAQVVENFAFHPSSLRLQKLDAMPMNSNGKPDYAVLSAQYL